MTAICHGLGMLFSFLVLLPTQPVDVRIDYTPAVRSSR